MATVKTIKISGKDYQGKLDWDTLCEIEDHFNLGAARLFSVERMGFSVIAVTLWKAFTLHDDKLKLTLKKMRNILQSHVQNGGTLGELTDFVTNLVEDSGLLNDEDDEEEETKKD